MRVGDRVAYVGSGWIGKALMKRYPQGAVVYGSGSEDGCPVVKWPSGGLMIVGDPSALLVTQTLENSAQSFDVEWDGSESSCVEVKFN